MDKDKLQTRGVMTDLGIAEIGSRDFEVELMVRNKKISSSWICLSNVWFYWRWRCNN